MYASTVNAYFNPPANEVRGVLHMACYISDKADTRIASRSCSLLGFCSRRSSRPTGRHTLRMGPSVKSRLMS